MTEMPEMPYTVHKREALFQGYFRIERLHLTVTRFNGGTMGPFTRELLERGHAVAILPYDPATDHVLLIEQFRPGPVLAEDSQPWLIEIVAGIIDAGEAPEQVARREAEEEANCVVDDLAHIMDCYSSPGCVSEHVDLYIGRAKLKGTGGVFGLQYEQEDIRTHILPFDTALGWLDEGRIKHSMAIIALQWLARHRGALRNQWLTGAR
ncbi:MAG: NUDIX domain-containing protein [Alphaproteobacteria bacterium]